MDRKLGGLILALFALPSAASDAWYAEKKVDPMTDKKKCHIGSMGGRESASLLFFFNGSEVSITGGGAYPGTHVEIRVDGNPSRKLREDRALRGADAAPLLREIRAGTVLKTRKYGWPRHDEQIGTSQIANLPQLLDDCASFVRS